MNEKTPEEGSDLIPETPEQAPATGGEAGTAEQTTDMQSGAPESDGTQADTGVDTSMEPAGSSEDVVNDFTQHQQEASKTEDTHERSNEKLSGSEDIQPVLDNIKSSNEFAGDKDALVGKMKGSFLGSDGEDNENSSGSGAKEDVSEKENTEKVNITEDQTVISKKLEITVERLESKKKDLQSEIDKIDMKLETLNNPEVQKAFEIIEES